jgi:F0F1-type ATP synthase membrane subunit c/vacuolar-type H+-ATPase subunit K
VMYIVVGEVGGLLASLGAIGCGLIGRKYAHSGTRAQRLASQGLSMGAVILVLIVGLNILGMIVSPES